MDQAKLQQAKTRITALRDESRWLLEKLARTNFSDTPTEELMSVLSDIKARINSYHPDYGGEWQTYISVYLFVGGLNGALDRIEQLMAEGKDDHHRVN